jgi:hypothetical protein
LSNDCKEGGQKGDVLSQSHLQPHLPSAHRRPATGQGVYVVTRLCILYTIVFVIYGQRCASLRTDCSALAYLLQINVHMVKRVNAHRCANATCCAERTLHVVLKCQFNRHRAWNSHPNARVSVNLA